MKNKDKVLELIKLFNSPPAFNKDLKGIFELKEDSGFITGGTPGASIHYMIRASIVFNPIKGGRHIILTESYESPILQMDEIVEKLNDCQEEFYKYLYVQLIKYSLFVKETEAESPLRHKIIPISKLIIGGVE